MIHLNIDKRYNSLKLNEPLKRAAETALQHSSASQDYELTLAITGDSQLRKLNLQFRGEDHATDVLSFPGQGHDPHTNRRYLGDVVISLPRAKAQAKTAGHSLAAEVQVLTVHGILHLLGHDHYDPQERQRMWEVENEIFDTLGLAVRAEQAEKAYSES
jgi:probable rRNA maturation factor